MMSVSANINGDDVFDISSVNMTEQKFLRDIRFRRYFVYSR